MATRPDTFDGFTVDLTQYPQALWGFAGRLRNASLDTLYRLHAREIARMVALQKDGADVGVALHPPQHPVELALKQYASFGYEAPWNRIMRDPFRFTAQLFVGQDLERPYIHLDVGDPRYRRMVGELPGVTPFVSSLDPASADPDLLDAVDPSLPNAGVGVVVSPKVASHDVERTWRTVPGIESLIIHEQPTAAERLKRVRAIPTRPRFELTEDIFVPLTVEDLHEYRRRR